MRRRDPTSFYVIALGAAVVGLAVLQGVMGSRRQHVPVGKPAPELAVPRLEGGELRLSTLRGKVVLIDFWARWCEPCQKVMPDLQRLHQRLRDKPFQLLSVNIEGAPADEVRAWMEERGFSFSTGQDRQGTARTAYQVSQIPLLVLVGPDGIVRRVYDGGASADALEKDVNSLLSG
jgi:thiol-disulfide isomerase/thioredoxin